MFWSVLNSKLSFIVNDNNASDGDDDDGKSSDDDGDDNLPNWPLYNNQRDTHMSHSTPFTVLTLQLTTL